MVYQSQDIQHDILSLHHDWPFGNTVCELQKGQEDVPGHAAN